MALKKTPIKTDLFRFVTLRTPQLINEQQKNIGFIFHIKKEASVFLKSVKPDSTITESRDIVLNAAKSFSSPFTTYLKVKEIDKDLYNFSSWLMDNRNTLIEAEVLEKAAGINALSETNLNLLWDNLYYQALTRKSSYVRQACIQMLIANNFILEHNRKLDEIKFKGSIDEYLERLANAKVVIDKAFTREEKIIKNSTNNLSKIKNKIETEANKFLLSESVEKYQQAIKELEELRNTYSNDYNDAYDSAFKTHEGDVKKLITDEVKTKQKQLQEEENRAALAEGRKYDEIPYDIETPEFNFEFKKPLSKDYTALLSNDTNTILRDSKITEGNSIDEAVKSINKSLDKDSSNLFTLTKTSKKTASINGVRINSRAGTLLRPYCFVVRTTPRGAGSLITMYINLGLDYYIVSETHTLTVSSNSYTTTDSQKQMEVDTYNTLLRLFLDETINLQNKEFNLSGEIVLSDGKTLTYNIDVPAKGFAKSCTVVTDENNPPSDTPVDVELYGVGKIGIADFRKVEQEVCCYVPGHVSHIENILAKEYKERATRSLLSVETTTETTTEKEVENLTDTTTTERNEMQSEVSNVLNEDKSSAYGASAGVDGKFLSGTYHADGYADFSNSSSSSQSNSNAQTYAQEVTERTLERIVKKTTKKQTSRILKEFEENNKHGFDNREGVQHVSGVYRWVDIIYKNQLVNYGKRLMYEFMIPEPARFFHDAVNIENPDDDCSIDIIEKPLHPSELGVFAINNSSQLTSYNYQKIASVYGVEVNNPPELYKSTGVSFTKSEAGGDGGNRKNKAAKEEVDVPKGYKSTSANVKISYVGTLGKKLSVAVGNKKQFTNGGSSGWSFYSIGNHTEKVPVSVYFNLTWVGYVNVNINFVRTDELLQQWENETYATIIEAYNDRLREYNEAKLSKCISEKQEGEPEKLRFNPLFNRAIEKREIKRICIEMLAKPFENPMDKDNYTYDAICNVPQVEQDADFENHAAHVKFFEQAFDWEIMAYLFYPYYWASKCDWKTLFQKTEASDPIFQAFLQSGMSRAVIPVRPGFEDAVVYYMETGDIWNGGDLVIDQEDDLYISIADEMLNIEGAVEKEWESRVPTNLTIIQKDTVGLEETGLPCCDFVIDNDAENPIQPSDDSQLGVVEGGIGKFVVS